MVESFKTNNGEWKLTGYELVFERDSFNMFKIMGKLESKSKTIHFLFLGLLLFSAFILSSNILPRVLIYAAIGILSAIGLTLSIPYIKDMTTQNRIKYSEIEYIEGGSIPASLTGRCPQLTIHYDQEKEQVIVFPEVIKTQDSVKYEEAVEKLKSEGLEVREE